MGSAVVVTIEEIEKSSPRKLVLVGGGLPVRGAGFGGHTTVKTTWYPGNGIGSQQVLGPQEMPSSWEGKWFREMLGRAPAKWTDANASEVDLVDPHLLFEALDSLRIGGALLRVNMIFSLPEQNADGEQTKSATRFTRIGRLVDCNIKIENIQWIEWTAQFDWISRGQPRTSPITTDSDSADSAAANMGTAAQALSAAINNWRAKSRSTNNPMATTGALLGQFEAIAGVPDKLAQSASRRVNLQINNVTRFLSILRKGATAPVSAANTLIGTATNIAIQANQWRNEYSRMPAELLTTKVKVAAMARAYNYFANVDAAQADLAASATVAKDRFARQQARSSLQRVLGPGSTATGASGAVLAVHTVRQGDTPTALSSRYYQSPDYAVDILKINRLPWTQTTLQLGSRLLIPRLNNVGVLGGRT